MNAFTSGLTVPSGQAVLDEQAVLGEQVGELVAAWEMAPGSLLLLGWQHDALPARGTAQLSRRRADRGPFRCITWPVGEGFRSGAQSFAIAVRLPQATRVQPGQTLTLEPDLVVESRAASHVVPGRPASILAQLPATLVGPLAFAEAAVRLAQGSPLPLARFLADVLIHPNTASLPGVPDLLAAFLAGTAEMDGCTEVLAGVPDACVMLQGWGQPDPQDIDCVLVGRALHRCRVQVASFDRPDIVAPSTGSVLVLPSSAAEHLNAATQVYLLTGQRPRRRTTIASPAVLGVPESLAHLRELLPALRCAPAVADCLRLAARARFQGVDTLNTGAGPVRMAVDLAVRFAEGAYLHGWLLDPQRRVAEVTIRSSAGGSCRLDQNWTRISRPDVTEAFRAEPGFAAARGRSEMHGFAAYAHPVRNSDSTLHLELRMNDGSNAFMPLDETCADEPWLHAKLLGTVDLHKPSGLAIVQHQLAPLFLTSPPTPAPLARTVGGADLDWETALVVALPDPTTLPRTFLSQFLHDPLAGSEGLVLVCGQGWQGSDLDRLRDELAFRSLPALLLQVDGTALATQALQAAAASTNAQYLLSVGSATHGRAPGWRRALHAALDAHPRPACACATGLYEDYSIRSTGIDETEILPGAPWFAAAHRLAGLPAGLVSIGTPSRVLAGTLSSCLLPRAVVPLLAAGSPTYLTTEAAELDLFLRLRRAGVDCLWVPDAQVYALDDHAPDHAGAARLVDGWCLRARWGGQAADVPATAGAAL